ncbi:MAG: hypothetical protein ABIG71_02410 [Candidatus Uhrbacteria bacterium]
MTKEERAEQHVYLVLDGDWGGQIFLTCPVELIPGLTYDTVDGNPFVTGGSTDQIWKLLEELDRFAWPSNEGDGAAMHLEMADEGEGVSGGMGGGETTDGLWLHREFEGTGDATLYATGGGRARPELGQWRARAMELLGIAS